MPSGVTILIGTSQIANMFPDWWIPSSQTFRTRSDQAFFVTIGRFGVAG